MRNYHNSIPTFGKFKNLLNEKVKQEFAIINDWHFDNFFKYCLIQCGFIGVIRYLYDNTLYLKLYYFDSVVRDNKREMETFVSSYFLHEKHALSYSACNIIRIPLKFQMDGEAIQAQKNMQSLESLLQLQLNEDSWISVAPTGTSGGLTISANPDKLVHEQRKKLLVDGFFNSNPGQEILVSSKTNPPSFWNKISRESDGVKINLSANKIVLSWNSVPLETRAIHSIKIKWCGVLLSITVNEYYAQRSNTIQAVVEYLNQSFSFGVGRCSLGAGCFGQPPNISIGNKALKFQFGKNCFSITEVIIGSVQELVEVKNESAFELVL